MRDHCPKCGARLFGFTREDYIQHLRANGETLAAKVESVIARTEADKCEEDS